MYNPGFLPVNTDEMQERGWNELDFLLITGDAYVDHPSFGIAIIARILENSNFKVGIIAQPKWQSLDAFRIMGKPRLACLISGGNLDSMVNHYTAAKKKRSNDAYSPGGKTGFRPDRATIVYSNRVREALPGISIIIGGIEASLRRFAHYDYWSNKVSRSILLDSQADMLVYGMGENPILEIAGKLAAGIDIAQIHGVRGTMVPWKERPLENTLVLPDWNQVQTDKRSYAKAFWIQYQQQDPIRGKIMYQKHDHLGVLQYPPAMPLSQAEMDKIYSLPFAGTYHPQYEEQGGVPAIKEVEFSLVSSRGCYGACSFCALTFHQGRIIQSRSAESIVSEAERLTRNPHFKGYIHDVGGPTANFRHPSCSGQLTKGTCNYRQCLFPQPCEKLNSDHREYLDLLRRLRELPGVKKVFVRSGVRYDTILADSKSDILEELCKYHVSGQLKVAPEHTSDAVLKYMGKPGRRVYEKFVRRFQAINQKIGKKQYLVPYLMSSHPGSSLKEAIELAEYIRDMGVNPEQVQDFIPTPGTLSTCMYFTGLDPRTMEKVCVPRSLHEKAMQKALIQYRNPANYDLVKEALLLEHREDLIGFGPKCLIKPRKINLKRKVIQSPDQREAHKNKKGIKPIPKEQTKKGRVLPTKVKAKKSEKSSEPSKKLNNKKNVRKK